MNMRLPSDILSRPSLPVPKLKAAPQQLASFVTKLADARTIFNANAVREAVQRFNIANKLSGASTARKFYPQVNFSGLARALRHEASGILKLEQPGKWVKPQDVVGSNKLYKN